MPTERLQKILARAGVSSRRAAEELITGGRVHVNGKPVTELGSRADPARDRIELDGRAITREHHVYYLIHKPRGIVTTLSDPEGRPNLGEHLARIEERVYPVGRLDFHTSGALLLTNDGDLAQALLHPSRAVPKTYVVKVSRELDKSRLRSLESGVTLDDGYKTQPAIVEHLRDEDGKSWIELTITEGKNRQIHRMLEALDCHVMRLSRVSFAGLSTEDLRPGEIRPLASEEVARLKREYLGAAHAREADSARAEGEQARNRAAREQPRTGDADAAPAPMRTRDRILERYAERGEPRLENARASDRRGRQAGAVERPRDPQRKARADTQPRLSERANRDAKFSERSAREARSSDRSGREPRSNDRAAREQRTSDRAAREPRSGERTGREARSSERSGREPRSNDRAAREQRTSDRAAREPRFGGRQEREPRASGRNVRDSRIGERIEREPRRAQRGERPPERLGRRDHDSRKDSKGRAQSDDKDRKARQRSVQTKASREPAQASVAKREPRDRDRADRSRSSDQRAERDRPRARSATKSGEKPAARAAHSAKGADKRAKFGSRESEKSQNTRTDSERSGTTVDRRRDARHKTRPT